VFQKSKACTGIHTFNYYELVNIKVNLIAKWKKGFEMRTVHSFCNGMSANLKAMLYSTQCNIIYKCIILFVLILFSTTHCCRIIEFHSIIRQHCFISKSTYVIKQQNRVKYASCLRISSLRHLQFMHLNNLCTSIKNKQLTWKHTDKLFLQKKNFLLTDPILIQLLAWVAGRATINTLSQVLCKLLNTWK